jgi:FtsH-binding integral membrane protein
METRRFVGRAAAYALATAAVVIAVAGYYESAGLLVSQIALIAGPTLVPFLILCGRPSQANWAVLALLTAAGWVWTVYIDTRPYEGGGASFAVFFGWFGCLVASVVAIVTRLAARVRERRKGLGV